MRKFKGTTGIRDTSKGKFEYHGFRHPLLEHSFGGFMHGHRKMADGTLRDADNWWDVWSKDVSIQSLDRHCEDLKALHAGFRVFKERVGDAEYTHIRKPDKITKKGKKLIIEWSSIPKTWREVDEEESCNGIRFNSMAYLLDVLNKQ